MKKLSSFQKQAVGLLAMLLVAAVLYGVYLFWPDNTDNTESVSKAYLTEQEQAAMASFNGKAVFTFKEKVNTKDVDTLTLMALALVYDEASDKISVVYGEGDKQISLFVNGKEAALGELFLYLEDGTPYATSARAAFNKALFGSALDAQNMALSGYDLDGDKVNAAGNAYLYGPVEREDIESIYVQNETSKIILINDGTSFVVSGLEAMTAKTANVATLVANCRAPVAVKKISDIKDLSVYGLATAEEALANVVVTDKKGNDYIMRIGKELPNEGGFYALVDGKDKIYVLMDSVKNTVLRPVEEFVTADYSLKLNSEEEIFKYVSNIDITFDDGEVLELDTMTEEEKKNHSLSYTWKIVGPDRLIHSERGYALPDYMSLSDILNDLCALSSDNIVAAEITDEALEEYGLKTPFRTYAYDHSGSGTKVRITIYASKPDVNGNFYVYSTKSDGEVTLTCGIGLIKESDVPFVNYEIVEYIDSYLYLEFIDYVDEMVFERDGETYRFVLAKNDKLEVTSATMNAESRDVQSVKKLYQSIIRCHVRGEQQVDKLPDPNLTLTILKSDGEKTVFCFRRISAVKVHVTVNGSGYYYVNYADFEELLTTMETVVAGKTVS